MANRASTDVCPQRDVESVTPDCGTGRPRLCEWVPISGTSPVRWRLKSVSRACLTHSGLLEERTASYS